MMAKAMKNPPREAQGSVSMLDRPVFESIRLNWWTVICIVIILVAIATRLWNLAPRAYSHDESIHAWESWKLATGQGYQHNPTYHGPFLYHFTAFIFLLFGHNDYTARLSPALFGIALVILPLFLRKWLGRKGTLAAMGLMTISPILLNRSRFIRHDVYVAVWTLLMAIGILRYLDGKRDRDLYLTAVALCLAFCTKEVAFIHVAIFGTFLVFVFYRRLFRGEIEEGVKYTLYAALGIGGLGALFWILLFLVTKQMNLVVLAAAMGLGALLAIIAGVRQWWRLRAEGYDVRKDPYFDLIIVIGTLCLPLLSPLVVQALGWNPIDYSQSAIVRSGIIFFIVLSISIGIGVWWDWQRWLVSAGLYYAIFIVLFTTMFTNGRGFATGMMGSLGYWLSQQGVRRGGQPWFYYLLLMPMYEFLPMLFGIAGTIYYLVRGRNSEKVAKSAETERGRPKSGTAAAEATGIPFVPLLIYWTFAAFALYSWAGEKMPWLGMHLALPFCLLAGWYIGQLLSADWGRLREQGGWWVVLLLPVAIYALAMLIFGSKPFAGTTLEQLAATSRWITTLIVFGITTAGLVIFWRRLGASSFARMAAVAVLIVLVLLTVRFAWMAAFKNGDIPVELMVYAQGAPDCRFLMDELEVISKRLVGDKELTVAYDDLSSWPFVWYFRDWPNATFFGSKPSGPFDQAVVIIGTGNEPACKPFLGNRYIRREYRLVWWPLQDYFDLTPKKAWQILIDPVKRRKLWNILFYRKYDLPLTQWRHVNRYGVYIRRDIVQQLWDFGPEVAVAEIELPEDEYVEKWTRIAAQRTWGMAGAGPGQFNRPKGLDVAANGDVYVVDSLNHRVQVFDKDGQFLRQWGGQGNGPGQFQEPWGIAVDSNAGVVYVCDTWNHRIQKFTLEGRFLTQWGAFGDSKGAAVGMEYMFYGPRDIVIDAAGNLYVADTGNKRIMRFDPDGKFLGQWGGIGDGEGQFQEPVGLVIDGQGNIYVADTWNRRIQKFDPNFRYLAQWPIAGWESMSVVNKPYLATDVRGNVYSTDPENFRILKFSGDGKLLKVWGQYGTDASSLNLPTGVAIGPDGRIYVTDSENNRVVVYPPVE